MPTPVSQLLADAAVTVVTGLGLTPTPTLVVKRKRPAVEQADGNGPLVIVCVGDEEEMEPLGLTAAGKMRWLVRRPLTVAVAVRSGGKIGENATVRAYREAVWPALTLTSLTAAGAGLRVNDVHPRGKPVFDPAGLKDGWDWSVLTLDTETTEDRDP